MAAPQSFKNHTKWDPMFHLVLCPITLIFSIALIVHAFGHRTDANIHLAILSVILLLTISKMRVYSLKVQDRVIRLEEKVRLAALCSPTQLTELESLTMRQYIGLRFASNTELPELAVRAVRENLTSKQIKEAVKSWRADDDRI
ncbi:DUF6526 family protein [Terriglobus tenax]|uniref:DUF6526 family protein n=1 Tax=Terriglobus tenax TaxID=1111115 RepID=UPI0021DFBA2A|nr:DUF6526 family protein [Terriglobus tenax]